MLSALCARTTLSSSRLAERVGCIFQRKMVGETGLTSPARSGLVCEFPPPETQINRIVMHDAMLCARTTFSSLRLAERVGCIFQRKMVGETGLTSPARSGLVCEFPPPETQINRIVMHDAMLCARTTFSSLRLAERVGCIFRGKMVGETGFEPATSASQTQRSTKLSYSP